MRKHALWLLGFLLLAGQLWAQTRTITGKVVDMQGNPLEGVTVSGRGDTRLRTATDAEGSFKLAVPTAIRSLTFSFVGFDEQTVTIGTSNEIRISLRTSSRDLDEVVVTGYSTKKRADFAGANVRVNAKQIEQVPMASFEQILQGRTPGVNIASGSGQPGTAANVNIRGVGSFSGSVQPLYILDGVPIESSVFRTLNPNDFESVDVLKDAVGAGIYGSRGANGVIVITTKRGKAGATKWQYRGMTGVSLPPVLRNVELMNTAQRLEYEEKILGPNGLGAGFPGWDWSPTNPAVAALPAAQQAVLAARLDSVRSINTNWPDELTRRGKFMQHELNASGGNDRVTYFNSLSYFKQEGIIPRSDLERYTYRGNIEFKADRLKVGVQSFFGYSEQNITESEAGVALANPIAAAYLELPYRRVRDDNGNVITGAGLTGSNALDRLNTTTQRLHQYKGNLAVNLQYRIWDGLSFRSINGVDWRNNNTSRWIDPRSFAGRSVAQGAQGSYNEGMSENLQLISTTGFVYQKTFAGKHAVNFQAMYEGIRNRTRNFAATGFGLNPNLPNTPAGITAGSSSNNLIPLIGGGRSLNGLSSVFFNLDYTLNRKYTFTAYLRRDAPSQVPKQNRNNWFWGVGGNWNLMMESFMENQNFFQDFRVRASYGQTANVNGFTSDFGFISTFGASSYAGVPGIVPTSPGNADYRLESQVLTNIGFDMTMLKRKLRVTLDVYDKESRDLFVNAPTSRSSGFRTLATNIGKMRNRGIDFLINGDVVAKKDLTITLGVNGGFLWNKILSIGDFSDIAFGTSVLRPGIPFGSHFQVGFLGIDPSSGLPIYTDRNGNPTNEYSAANNRTDFGTYLPRFTGGATVDITYKGFFLNTLFSTSQGYQRFNNESFFYETTNSNVGFNKSVDMLTQTWQKPGDVTNFQRITAQRQFSSRDIRDASFIRWRNLQVGYNFSVPSSKLFSSFRLWAQGQNLMTWTKWAGFDPEESNNIATYEFPNPTTYTLGLDLNF